ncbi:MAG: MoaD/ThiS family protein [Spirochaetota bacterium]
MQDSVRITIKYLVNLRDRAGKRVEEVSFLRGSTLWNVARWLSEKYNIKLPDPKIIAILNGKGWEQLPEKFETRVDEGDIICLFPPVSGG